MFFEQDGKGFKYMAPMRTGRKEPQLLSSAAQDAVNAAAKAVTALHAVLPLKSAPSSPGGLPAASSRRLQQICTSPIAISGFSADTL